MKRTIFLFLPSILLMTLPSCHFADFLPVVNEKQLVLSGDYPKEFTVGDYFKITGLVVKCDEEVITNYNISPFIVGNRLNDVGTFTVTISKENYKSASYDIRVNALKQLFVNSLPTITTYECGDSFSSDGLSVVDELNNPVTDYTLSIANGTELKIAGTKTIDVTKQDYISDSFEITITERSGQEFTYRDLTIYYINDTHGSYTQMREYYEPGMSAISSYIRTRKQSNEDNTLVLSGGDMFQGGFESNSTNGAIMADAMNIIGFDAMAVGNHEFDWGETAAENISSLLNFPMLSSNIFYSNSNERPEWLSPYTIINKEDLKIGIIGAAQYNLGSSIDGTISKDFYFPSPNAYIKSFSTELRLNQGCDLVLALFHDEGYDVDRDEVEPTKFNDLTQIDSQTGLKYVDAMFFSHDHYKKEGTYNGVPYIESQCNGRNVGELTLSLRGNGVSYQVIDSSVNNVDMTDYYSLSDSSIDALATKPEYVNVFAQANQVLYTFANTYSKEDFTEVACMAMLWYVNQHKNYFDNVTVYFASHNTGGVRAKVYRGSFTMRHFVKVFPFDNKLVIQTCTSTNISYMSRSNYYRTAQADDIVYTDGYTKAVSITYITEYRVDENGRNSCQVSRIIYDNYTAKDALYEYLTLNINSNL